VTLTLAIGFKSILKNWPRGVWLNVGSPSQMIHWMGLPILDPIKGCLKHGKVGGEIVMHLSQSRMFQKSKEVFDKAGMYVKFWVQLMPLYITRLFVATASPVLKLLQFV